MFLLKGVKQNLNEGKEHTILFDRNIYFYNNVIFPKMILKIQCDSNLKSVLVLCCDLSANVKVFLCLFFLFSCHEKLMHKQSMSRGKELSGADKVGEWWRVDLTKPQEAGKLAENWLNFYHVRVDPGSRTGHGEGADWAASKGQALCLQDHLYLVSPVESGQLWWKHNFVIYIQVLFPL